jgi:hypothetical protein
MEPKDLVSRINVIDALRSTGIQVELEKPILEDYRNAEKRACLHLCPLPLDSKIDEMRDLIIWEVALRIAKRDGKAMLLSRDEVHSHERGQSEAESVGLLRAKTIDDALDLLGKQSPAGALARKMLQSVWSEMRANGLPLPDTMSLSKVTYIEFTTDQAGQASGNLTLSAHTERGLFSARIQVVQLAPNIIQAKLTNVSIDKGPWHSQEIEITAKGELPHIARPESDRLRDLQHILGGDA